MRKKFIMGGMLVLFTSMLFMSFSFIHFKPEQKALSGSVYIFNNIGNEITAVSGITGFTFSGPLLSGTSQTGTHTVAAVGSNISFTVGSPGSVNGYACLFINGTLVESIHITAIGNYSFSSHPYYDSESIGLYITSAGCPD